MRTGSPPEDRPAARTGERAAIILALLLLAGLAWAYTARQAWLMEHMDHAAMRAPTWAAADLGVLIAMWAAMMVAMMAPSVAPMVIAFSTINGRRRARGGPHVATVVFLAGYLLAWGLYSVLASVAQIGLHASGRLDPMMSATSSRWAAALFAAAGAYQLSPLKEWCLARCRSTEGFILSEWRDGALGAVVMGLRHGLFCIGCCGALMALLFAVAVMDLRWVAGLSVLAAAEKLLPNPALWRRLIAVTLLLAAAAIGVGGLPA